MFHMELLNIKIPHIQNKHIDNFTGFFVNFRYFSLTLKQTTRKIEKRVK